MRVRIEYTFQPPCDQLIQLGFTQPKFSAASGDAHQKQYTKLAELYEP